MWKAWRITVSFRDGAYLGNLPEPGSLPLSLPCHPLGSCYARAPEPGCVGIHATLEAAPHLNQAAISASSSRAASACPVSSSAEGMDMADKPPTPRFPIRSVRTIASFQHIHTVDLNHSEACEQFLRVPTACFLCQAVEATLSDLV